MERLPGHSPDLVEQNIAKLKELFPSVVTEGVDESGRPVEKIDFDALRQELSDHVVEGPEERFQLDWPGKRQAALAANAPVAKTLRPQREESVDFDTTRNLFIEGDNLDVLKLLQESYLSKVDVIYIDPPYNTGNDFIYNDDFSQSTEEYLTLSGQVDEEGSHLVANPESHGRFHSDWLSMMYPRLKLARNLLAEDGVIFISIDDNEVDNLLKVCDEIFGESNHVATLAVEISKTQGMKVAVAQRGQIVKNHEYVLVYSRTKAAASHDRTPLYDAADRYDPHFDIVLNESLQSVPLTEALAADPTASATFTQHGLKMSKANLATLLDIDDAFHDYFLETYSANLYAEMLIGLRQIQDLEVPPGVVVKHGKYLLRRNSKGTIRQLQPFSASVRMSDEYKPARSRVTIRGALWKGFYSDMMNVGKEGGVDFKNGKKPTRLILQLIKWANRPAGLVLDFFAGSGTTAQAVMTLNAQDDGKRRFILVQLDEPVNADSTAAKAGHATISDLARERIRRVGPQTSNEPGLHGESMDTGFRSLRVDSSGRTDVFATADDTSQASLGMFASNIAADRSRDDLLFQVLLEWGLELSLPIERSEVDGHEVFDVDSGALVACFDTELSDRAIEALAQNQPLRIVFRDDAFADDAARINAEQTIQQIAPDTEVRVL